MLFNSLEFLIFFPIVIALYFATPHKWRWVLLLAASYYFYMCWKPEYIILIIVSTIIDYIAARGIARSPDGFHKKLYLGISMASNLGILFFFKYFTFLNESTRALFDSFNIFYGMPMYDILLPVGISFYTFQTMSYTIDVYRGTTQVENHFGKFAVFVSFFPQLVAGPIERSSNLLPQVHEKHEFDYDRIVSGLRLMLWGLFKKIVIADRAAAVVNLVFNNPDEYEGFQTILATFLFAFQIYCDFSGYSDIAIGTARVMGYDLMLNFRRPYFAKDIKDFWSRWHISLSTWFRDYVYIPLGGNRVSKPRRYFNLFITFMVSGIWHGANWTFLVWGALHGIFQIIAIAKDKLLERLPTMRNASKLGRVSHMGNVLITFILVCIGWVFFRANNITDAFAIFSSFAAISKAQLGLYIFGPYVVEDLIIALAFIALLLILEWLMECKDVLNEWFPKQKRVFRWSMYLMFCFFILAFGKFDKTEFIYFAF
jgi:D-alanyl-lipoteichoic acid acyltransferase DltB (MBOAT superfamily)